MTTILALISFASAHGATIMAALALLGHIFPPKTAAYKVGDLAEKAKAMYNE